MPERVFCDGPMTLDHGNQWGDECRDGLIFVRKQDMEFILDNLTEQFRFSRFDGFQEIENIDWLF